MGRTGSNGFRVSEIVKVTYEDFRDYVGSPPPSTDFAEMLLEENISILDGMSFDTLGRLWTPIRDVFGIDLKGPSPVGAQRYFINYKASEETRRKLSSFAIQFDKGEDWAARGVLLNGLVREMEEENYTPDLTPRS